MKAEIHSSNIANGTVHYSNRTEKISDVEWVKHPKFKGVYLKNMIKGFDTDNLFSSHLVKIDPGCSLEPHCHGNQIELHEVIEGTGTCKLCENVFDYHFGKMAVIPQGENHSVHAGEGGLILLAKFFPAVH